ncbi:carboxylating nicotinate-nucleotide diphosphorylase [PVC group bacterium]|nr:carboxylating nicotinate-nucleotide diphosphorylase [PVC group bacterium]
MNTILKSHDVQNLIRLALDEDSVRHDVTANVAELQKMAEAHIIAKEPCVLAGVDVLRDIFRKLNKKIRVTALYRDGAYVTKGCVVFKVKGNLVCILKAERTALNFLGRMSGVASLTRKYIKALGRSKTKIYDTRKTIPGWRVLDKYAVIVGGGTNHRMNLSDGVLLKENHLQAFNGGVSLNDIVRKYRKGKRPRFIEIEVRNIKEACLALQTDADIIMFDNMKPGIIRKIIHKTRLTMPKKRTVFEASGGITLKNIKDYAHLGLNRIAIGAITHSARTIDFTCLVQKVSSL